MDLAVPPNATGQNINEKQKVMAITLNEKNGGQMLEVSLTGKLVKEGYETFVPVVERLVKQPGKIRMLVAMHDFHGWTAAALWEATKFAAHHFCEIAPLARYRICEPGQPVLAKNR
jgi:hypothetical protein